MIDARLVHGSYWDVLFARSPLWDLLPGAHTFINTSSNPSKPTPLSTGYEGDIISTHATLNNTA